MSASGSKQQLVAHRCRHSKFGICQRMTGRQSHTAPEGGKGGGVGDLFMYQVRLRKMPNSVTVTGGWGAFRGFVCHMQVDTLRP